MKIKSIELLSNNPDKIEVWQNSGISITNRIPLIITSNKHNEDYLEIKKEKLNHLL